MHTVVSMVFQLCFCCRILFRRSLLGGSCILREIWELSGAVSASSVHQHLKDFYLFVAGCFHIIEHFNSQGNRDMDSGRA
jgi:hypothetical protein